MNPMEKHKEKNKTSENMTYIIDKKIFMCQHNKFDPLKARRGKQISERMYRYIEYIIQNDSQKYITSEGGEDLLSQKWTYCKIDYDLYSCSYSTKSLC